MAELLIRKRQLALRTEAVKGTYETALDTDMTAAGHANFLLVDPSHEVNITNFPRNVRHAALTQVAGFFPGISSISVTFGIELAGHRSNDGVADHVEPPCGPILAACGLTSEAVTPWTIATYDMGTRFLHGETITGAMSSATAVVVGDTVSGLDTVLYFRDLMGGPFTSGEAVTGSLSGTVATMTGSPSAVDKWAFRPNSDTSDAAGSITTLSGVYYIDGIRYKFKGARGTLAFNMPHADRAQAQITLTGIIEDVEDNPLLSGVVIDHPKPPAVLGTNLRLLVLGQTAWSPVYNSATVDMGNNVILRENSADADGWSFATLPTRAPTMTFNPDEVLEADHPLYENARQGFLHQTRLTLGSAASASNLGGGFAFRIPALQVTGFPEGNRDEVTTRDITANLVGGEGPNGELGIDDEVVIINT